ncbi:hypothetical protein [Brunnivagina elsteri]|uniref:hypothetical protein n=1 Tax=Brunnivagina elsteri TaxID=1247191 RepID=UPI0013044FA5|nr:hypothetical protein [Calothrix elsteri]
MLLFYLPLFCLIPISQNGKFGNYFTIVRSHSALSSCDRTSFSNWHLLRFRNVRI